MWIIKLARDRWTRLELIKRFSIVASVCVLACALVFGWLLKNTAYRMAQDGENDLTAAVVRHQFSGRLSNDVFRTGQPIQDPGLGEELLAALSLEDVFRIKIFGKDGVRWFHTGGIFAALSETTPQVVTEAVTAAKEHGTITSYDLNYRSSLWKSIGGKQKAIEVNRMIAPHIDVMMGNEEDFTAALGFQVEGLDGDCSSLDTDNFKKMMTEALGRFPNFKVVATTLRNAKTAMVNDWGAILYADGEFHEATLRKDLEIYDRVGGGDSFASGLIYGLMKGKSPAEAVNYGAAHGALAMTTPGDTTTASLAEVKKVMQGGTARVDR